MRYLLRRTAMFVLTLWAAVTLNFIIPRLMPGSPADAALAKFAGQGAVSPAQRQAIETMLGLPHGGLLSQYWAYLGDLAGFRFGTSYTYFPQPVASVIGQALPWTLVLVGTATVIAFVAGTLLGVLAAWRRGGALDALATVGSSFSSAFPYFWTALLLLFAFGFTLGWFPLHGGYSADATPQLSLPFVADAAYHSVLPAITIIISVLGGWVLSMRNNMITSLGEDYVTFAEANGLRRRTIALRYAARNALRPNMTLSALALGLVVSGSILTEYVFGYPAPPLAAPPRALPRPLLLVSLVAATLWAERKARTGLVILATATLAALLAPVIAPYSPTYAGFTRSLPPSGSHLLGTTGSGQDAFSQLLYGARISLLVAFAAGALATVVAVVVGLLAGYLPGLANEVLMFVTNLVLVIPNLVLMIVLAVYLAGGGVKVIVLVVVAAGWATGARVMRSQASTLRSRDFVALAQFGGERLHRIVFREVLPSMTSLVAANFCAAATAAVMGEAGLEFLGLGDHWT